MKAPATLLRAEAKLRKLAMAYPRTVEEFPWEHRAFKVKGKTFLFLSIYQGVLRATMKLPVSGKASLNLPFASPTAYGLAKSGWVTAAFQAKDKIPLEMLAEWMDESFRAIAPKKKVAKIGVIEPTAAKGAFSSSKGNRRLKSNSRDSSRRSTTKGRRTGGASAR
jgi:predicted DNA-binding protein (MmcQ/YjbR family)